MFQVEIATQIQIVHIQHQCHNANHLQLQTVMVLDVGELMVHAITAGLVIPTSHQLVVYAKVLAGQCSVIKENL